MKKISALGNALVDILVSDATENLLESLGLKKGAMTHISRDQLESILKKIENQKCLKCGGGSAANTVHALGILGQKAAFIGKVGQDQLGDFYKKELEEASVEIKVFNSTNHTGCAIGFITPDAERTFATYLGAAIELKAEEIDPLLFNDANLVHIEGYLVQDYSLIEKAVATAHKNNCLISIDLSSFNVVEEHHHFLKKIIEQYADFVFANEQEAQALCCSPEAERIFDLPFLENKTIILKKGSAGSKIKKSGKIYSIPPFNTAVRDTTGAGDLYAAGFFYGYLNNLSIEQCGSVASYLAAKAIEDIGARIAAYRWTEIKREIQQIIKSA